jgi:hypothetical protein
MQEALRAQFANSIPPGRVGRNGDRVRPDRGRYRRGDHPRGQYAWHQHQHNVHQYFDPAQVARKRRTLKRSRPTCGFAYLHRSNHRKLLRTADRGPVGSACDIGAFIRRRRRLGELRA